MNMERQIETMDRLLREYLAAPEEEKGEVLRRLYRSPVAQALVEISVYDPEVAWRKRQAEKYEAFLFRNGSMQLRREKFRQQLWEHLIPRGLPDEYIESMVNGRTEDLNWAKRFNGSVPVHWWDTRPEVFRRGGFKFPLYPDIHKISYDFQVAGALDLQLRPVLIDAAICQRVMVGQLLDAEQFGVFLYLMHDRHSLERHQDLFGHLTDDERLQASLSRQRAFQEEMAELITTQESRGVDKSIIEAGIQIHDQLWRGTIEPPKLRLLRRRFVPEYLLG